MIFNGFPSVMTLRAVFQYLAESARADRYPQSALHRGGNLPSDTQGCILPGENKGRGAGVELPPVGGVRHRPHHTGQGKGRGCVDNGGVSILHPLGKVGADYHKIFTDRQRFYTDRRKTTDPAEIRFFRFLEK